MALCNIGLSCLSINQFNRTERNSVLGTEARRILSILADSPLASINAIATDENGRPFLYGSNVDFSISHSGSAVAVSLVSDENIHRAKIRTGCDIQLIRPRKNLRNIAEENFSAAERDYILLQNETWLDRFFQIWTLKECYIKLRGLSVFDMPKVPSFISGNDTADRNLFAFDSGSSSPLSFYLYELAYAGECYALAIAIEKVSYGDPGSNGDQPWDIQPELRIFSQSSEQFPLNICCNLVSCFIK